MDRTEALAILGLEGSSAGHAVERAYWARVRRAQKRSGDDPQVAAEVERLNAAYTALSPSPQRYATSGRDPLGPGSGVALVDWFAEWITAQAVHTRRRWSGRNPEISIIGGGAIVLVVLAIGAGASLVATFAAVILVCAAIWAPWRPAG